VIEWKSKQEQIEQFFDATFWDSIVSAEQKKRVSPFKLQKVRVKG